MSKYQENKQRIREEAIEWQLSTFDEYFGGLNLWLNQDYFRKMGKRYGLLREFRENGIC